MVGVCVGDCDGRCWLLMLMGEEDGRFGSADVVDVSMIGGRICFRRG